MFPLIKSDAPNPLKLFQIWLNLPKKSKMVEPAFTMVSHFFVIYDRCKRTPHILITALGWKHTTIYCSGWEIQSDNLGRRIQWSEGTSSAHGSNPISELAILFVELQPGGSISLPAAKGGQSVNRRAYFVEGQSLLVGEQVIPPSSAVTLNAGDAETVFSNAPSSSSLGATIFLILQGRPIAEPVAQQGPFVMNSMAEIQQAYADYRQTQFGGWPWPQNAMVFERSKGRFSLQNGQERLPPSLEDGLWRSRRRPFNIVFI